VIGRNNESSEEREGHTVQDLSELGKEHGFSLYAVEATGAF